MTDQQRWDTLSRAGNNVLKTPSMDRLADEGAYFEICNSHCPVCGPARTTMLTGQTLEHTTCRTNMDSDVDNKTSVHTYDEILVDQGYVAEYYGKWHSPLGRALKYQNAVTPAGKAKWERGPGMHQDYMDFLNERYPRRKLKPGEQYCNYDDRPYLTNPLDTRHVLEPGVDMAKGVKSQKVSQPDQHGISSVPADCTVTAKQGIDTIDALERMAKDGRPFSLHCSFHYPHAPMLPSEPYASMFKPEDMMPPKSISDSMENSPYVNENGRKSMPEYSDPEKIKYMIANYYALVKEIDEWVGRILDKLDKLGLSNNTMVIFTSDHGEMLGAHGMREKNVFYEESVHVPLVIKFPGRIKRGSVVKEPVSQIDLYATILDYMGAGKHISDGTSLRRYIESARTDEEAYSISEWNWRGPVQPNLMVRTRRWKFFCPNMADSQVMNVLYDLENDPYEMNNLLGNNPDADKYHEQAEQMKKHLIEWLERVGSPYLEEVRKRKT